MTTYGQFWTLDALSQQTKIGMTLFYLWRVVFTSPLLWVGGGGERGILPAEIMCYFHNFHFFGTLGGCLLALLKITGKFTIFFIPVDFLARKVFHRMMLCFQPSYLRHGCSTQYHLVERGLLARCLALAQADQPAFCTEPGLSGHILVHVNAV